MPRKRIVRREPAALTELPDSLHPVLRRVFAARNVRAADQIEYSLAQLPAYDTLTDIGPAVTLLVDALQRQRRILIVGDFDADGATSCALAVLALRALGAAEVSYLVPNRFDYGYGLTPEIVAVAAQSRPHLLVTVDNGISSLQGVAAARAAGMQVLVTDHHLPGRELPAADAIVNPNQPGDVFPGKNLAGVGVMFYLLMALRVELRRLDWFAQQGIEEPNLAQWLDLVALGTVADVVPLDHINRILVAQGLSRIRAGRCRAGIRALLTTGKRQPANLCAADLGFAVAPRLNAAGRLDDMSLGIECLLTDDAAQAVAMAQQLDEMNTRRRVLEADMREQALAGLGDVAAGLLAEDDAGVTDADARPAGVCLYDARWHQGIIGILAARVREQLFKPVIVFADSGEDGWLKGSGRSVPGLHLRDALDAVAVNNPGLIPRFGGHAMAAGLSLRQQDLPVFEGAFAAEVERRWAESDRIGCIDSDGELQAGDLALDLALRLESAGPWGQGFPAPVFDGVFDILDRRPVGEGHLKLGLAPAGTRQRIDAIAFNIDPEIWSGQPHRLHLAYRLDVNRFRGQQTAQLVIEHAEPVVEDPVP